MSVTPRVCPARKLNDIDSVRVRDVFSERALVRVTPTMLRLGLELSVPRPQQEDAMERLVLTTHWTLNFCGLSWV